MIPEQNTFYFSEKSSSLLYVIERYYEGVMGETRVSHLKVADFKTLKTIYIKVEDMVVAIEEKRLKQVG